MREYVQAYRHASAAGHARIMATLEEEGGVGVAGRTRARGEQAGESETMTQRPYAEALGCAAEQGHLRILRALVEEGGADVNSVTDEGCTVLGGSEGGSGAPT